MSAAYRIPLRIPLLTILLLGAGLLVVAAHSASAQPADPELAAPVEDPLALVRRLMESGRPHQALSGVEELLRVVPDDPDARFLKGLLLAEIGRRDAAKQYFLELAEAWPERPEPLINLGVLLAEDGELALAAQALERALATDPVYGSAFDNLRRIYAARAGRAQAEALDEALGLGASGGPLGNRLGLTLLDELQAPPLPPGWQRGRAAGRGSELAEGTTWSDSRRTGDEPYGDAPADLAQPSEPAVADPDADIDATAAATDALEPEAPEADALVAAADGSDTRQATAGGADESTAGTEADTDAEAERPAGIAGVITAWADAWRAGDMAEHFSFYSARFTPPAGLDAAAWQTARRRASGEAPDRQVLADSLESRIESPTAARATFTALFPDGRLTNVTLALAWEDGGWRIAEERGLESGSP